MRKKMRLHEENYSSRGEVEDREWLDRGRTRFRGETACQQRLSWQEETKCWQNFYGVGYGGQGGSQESAGIFGSSYRFLEEAYRSLRDGFSDHQKPSRYERRDSYGSNISPKTTPYRSRNLSRDDDSYTPWPTSKIENQEHFPSHRHEDFRYPVQKTSVFGEASANVFSVKDIVKGLGSQNGEVHMV
jgi:hypothetical protein